MRGLTPYEFICKQWAIEPERITSNPHHQSLGLNTYSDAVIPPIGEARDEWTIYRALGRRMGLDNPFAGTPSANDEPDNIDAADAVLRMSPCGDGFGARAGGLSHEALLQYHPSGVRYAEAVEPDASWDAVRTDGQQIDLWPSFAQAEIARLSASTDQGGLRLFGRRALGSLNSWMHNDERLVRNERPSLLIHPRDAIARGIVAGSYVRVTSAAGVVELMAEPSDAVTRGSVCYPHGWGHNGGWKRANATTGANINLLASTEPGDWEQIGAACVLDGIDVEVRLSGAPI